MGFVVYFSSVCKIWNSHNVYKHIIVAVNLGAFSALKIDFLLSNILCFPTGGVLKGASSSAVTTATMPSARSAFYATWAGRSCHK